MEEEDGGGRKRKARGVAKASSKKKARRSGSAGKGTAAAAKDAGEGGSSQMLDEKEMKRMLREQLALMRSPADRAKLMEEVDSHEIYVRHSLQIVDALMTGLTI